MEQAISVNRSEGSSAGNPWSVPSSAPEFPKKQGRRVVRAFLGLILLLIGGISVGLRPLVEYGGEVARRVLGAHQIYLSYDSITPSGIGLKLTGVSIRIPPYSVIEQLDELSATFDLWQLIRLSPTVTVSARGLGGSAIASMNLHLKSAPTISRLVIDRIALRRSTTLTPFGLSNGTLAGEVTQTADSSILLPSEDSSLTSAEKFQPASDVLSSPHFIFSLKVEELEKGSPSEIFIPPLIRKSVIIPGLALGESVTVPAIPPTTFAIDLVVGKSNSIVKRASLHSSGVEISGQGEVPMGSGGIASIGLTKKIELSGKVRVNKMMATLASFVLRPPVGEGTLIADTPMSFEVKGVPLRPRIAVR